MQSLNVNFQNSSKNIVNTTSETTSENIGNIDLLLSEIQLALNTENVINIDQIKKDFSKELSEVLSGYLIANNSNLINQEFVQQNSITYVEKLNFSNNQINQLAITNILPNNSNRLNNIVDNIEYQVVTGENAELNLNNNITNSIEKMNNYTYINLKESNLDEIDNTNYSNIKVENNDSKLTLQDKQEEIKSDDYVFLKSEDLNNRQNNFIFKITSNNYIKNDTNPKQQLIQKIVYNLENKTENFKLTLTPKELGSVNINLSVENDVIKMQIKCENDDTTKALANGFPKLNTILEKQMGFKVEVEYSFNQSDTKENLNQNFSEDRSQNSQHNNKNNTYNGDFEEYINEIIQNSYFIPI